MLNDLEKVMVESAQELRNWLSSNHQQKESVWLIKWKKESKKPFIRYDEIVDQLICFGWIDSLPRKLDDQKTMLRISPRNPKSNWSRVNKERVEKLLQSKQMAPSGLQLVNQAKLNGAWNFLDDVEQLIIPNDLAEALASQKNAQFYFDKFPPSSKRGILEWIKTAKQDATRQKRIEETVKKAAQNIKANHPKGRE